MSTLKDTDFDDLFRRASDKYPLRTDSSDWDRMAAALEKDPPPDTPDGPDNQDKRRRRRFLLLFLLLPLAGIGYYTWHSAGHGSAASTGPVATATKPVATSANPVAAAATNTAGTNTAGTSAATPTTANPVTPAASGTGEPTVETPSTPPSTAQPMTSTATRPGTGSAPQPSSGLSTATGESADAASTGLTAVHTQHKTNLRGMPSGTHAGHRADERLADDKTTIDNTTAGNTVVANTARGNASIDPRTNPVAAAFTLRSTNIDEQRAAITGPYSLVVDVKAPTPQKEPTRQQDSTKHKPKSSYLYAGIIAAPDFSTVRFQKMTGVGNTFGILLGYAFNDHWAIETGAYVERKRYYSAGEYFNTKKVNFNYNNTLLNVDGTCYMWEIPLNIRYTFNPAGKTRWFATGGLSTYLMTGEKYFYEVENYTRTWKSEWDLKTPSQYPFSIISLSAGFEQHLGKVGNLRVEPYLRIPLGGIGTGNLPILSTGINIGITRRLW